MTGTPWIENLGVKAKKTEGGIKRIHNLREKVKSQPNLDLRQAPRGTNNPQGKAAAGVGEYQKKKTPSHDDQRKEGIPAIPKNSKENGSVETHACVGAQNKIAWVVLY